MRAALDRHDGSGVLIVIAAVVVLLAVIVPPSLPKSGGDAAKFTAAANKACADADKALADLEGSDPAAQVAILTTELDALRAIDRPDDKVVEIGHFIVFRGLELRRTEAAAWRARRGQDEEEPAVAIAAGSAVPAKRLGLDRCATRGVVKPSATSAPST